jgi:hypothetical protein
MPMPLTQTLPETGTPQLPIDGGRLEVKRRSRRGESSRIGLIAAVAMTIATVLVALAYLVGVPMATAWWLESQSGTVSWDIDAKNWQHGGVTSVSFSPRQSWSPPVGIAELKQLRHLHRVISLNLAENDLITDKGLAALRGLDHLRDLSLERMGRYRNPEWFRRSVLFTDSCLVHIQALPRLESLILSGNLITDQGLAQIARMANLRELDLEATEVSDAGLAHLEGMTKLKRVHLGATRVTQGALTRLQMAMPDLTIEMDCDESVVWNVKQFRGMNP